MLYSFSKKNFNIDRNICYVEANNIDTFNEILISWNAERPIQGYYEIDLSLFINNTWSHKISYAKWAENDQIVYSDTFSSVLRNLFQTNLAKGFRVFLKSCNNANLDSIWGLHISTLNIERHKVKSTEINEYYNLKVPKISQWHIEHEQPEDLCSPTSVTSVLHFLNKNIDAKNFAAKVNNNGIYGIWCLNISQAAHELGNKWNCYVTRFESFDQIINFLKRSLPVIVSIKGPISGSTYPYKNGHILVVRGYDSNSKQVLCMDPGFHEINETYVNYNLDEFMISWGERRKGLVYIFDPIK